MIVPASKTCFFVSLLGYKERRRQMSNSPKSWHAAARLQGLPPKSSLHPRPRRLPSWCRSLGCRSASRRSAPGEETCQHGSWQHSMGIHWCRGQSRASNKRTNSRQETPETQHQSQEAQQSRLKPFFCAKMSKLPCSSACEQKTGCRCRASKQISQCMINKPANKPHQPIAALIEAFSVLQLLVHVRNHLRHDAHEHASVAPPPACPPQNPCMPSSTQGAEEVSRFDEQTATSSLPSISAFQVLNLPE